MDLRTRKSKIAIRNAFLQLRAHHPLEQIRIKDLTELAMISKGTFYLHYHDIYDLSDSLQQEIIQEIIASIQHPELMITDPGQFTYELMDAFRRYQGLTDILFSGLQSSVLPTAIEEALRNHLSQNFPEFYRDPRFNILMTFEVQGGYYAYTTHRDKYRVEDIVDTLHQTFNAIRILHPDSPK